VPNPCISPGRRANRAALLAALCVLVAACGAPRFRAEPPAPAEPPVAAETWALVGAELRQIADEASEAAHDYAQEAMGRWFRRVSALTESEFVPWATDYWTHQWLSLKLAWYGTDEADGNAGGMTKLTDHLADEYRSQVLEPVAEEIDPLQVMDEASALYAGALVSGIRELQQRHALPPRQLAAWLAGIPLLAAPPGASLGDLTDATGVTDLPAYQELTAGTRGRGKAKGFAGLDAAMRPVAERTAERLSATLAVRGGAAAASLLGGAPGMLLSLGISAWDATAHEQERPALETALRSDLDGALRTALWQLLHDRTAGVLAPLAHMASQLDGALPAPPVPLLIEAGPVQGLF
jgi:hypothetical protein